jgi:hypothetical protein
MKKRVLSVVTMMSLLAALAVAGQASIVGTITVNIPFDFMVGEKKLPAGQYTIDRTNIRECLLISRIDRRANVLANTYPGRTSRKPSRVKLVFNRYGEQYFLSQVWGEGHTVAMQLSKSRAERELAKKWKHLARNADEPETVTVMAQ